MATYDVSTYVTPLGTLEEVEGLLETFVESLDNAATLRMLGINPVSRDRDRCIGFVMYDSYAKAESAYHVLEDDGPLTITTNP